MFRFTLLAGPFLNTILLYEMFLGSSADSFFSYVVLGAGLMGIWGCICFSSAGDINRERFSGTLPLIFAAPASFRLIIYGKIIGNTIVSLVTFAVSILTSALLFKVPVRIASPVFFLLSLIASVISFIAISSVIACLLTLSRKTELYMNLIELPVALLCGFVFPVEILPAPVRAVSYALSPTWAAKLLRLSVEGITDTASYMQQLLILSALTFTYLLLAAMLYRIIDKQVRIQATLEVA